MSESMTISSIPADIIELFVWAEGGAASAVELDHDARSVTGIVSIKTSDGWVAGRIGDTVTKLSDGTLTVTHRLDT